MSLERISFRNLSSPAVKEHISRYVFASSFCRNKIILDAACGLGYGSNILRCCGAKNAVGVDISKNAVAYARKHYPECNFSTMDATQLGFCEEVFDVVCSFETIEHIKQHKMYLTEIKGALNPGGLLIISTPLKEVWSPYGNKSANPYHVQEFSQKEFCSLISDYFQIVELYGQEFSAVKRFILYPYEVISLRIFGRKRILLDKILEKLRNKRNRNEDEISLYRKNRFVMPKYIIAICKKPKK